MKKALSLIVAILLVWGMAPAAFAASGKIQGMNQEITARDFSDIEVSPGRTYEIPLTADMFEWSGNAGEAKEPVTQSQINSAKINIKTTYTKTKSKDIIEDISIKYKAFSESGNKKTAYILVEFVGEYSKTDEVDFEFTVYLTINGKRDSYSEIPFSGTFSRPVIYADEGETYIDLSDGDMVEPESYLRSVDVYLGEGVFINAKLTEGKKYYGTATRGIKNEDAAVADAYPEIVTALTLDTNITSGTVTFELEDEYYVYNAEGKYVGTSEDEHKYSKKYYLADEKIDLTTKSNNKDKNKDDDDDDDDKNTSVPVKDDKDKTTSSQKDEDKGVPVEEDDDWGYSNDYSNVNDNPSTGANGVVTVAALAGLGAASVAFTTRRR